MEFDPGVAVRVKRDTGLVKADVSLEPRRQRFVDGFFDGEAKNDCDPAPFWRKLLDPVLLFRSQDLRGDVEPFRIEVFEVDPEYAQIRSCCDGDGHVLFVGDRQRDAGRSEGCPSRSRIDGGEGAAKSLDGPMRGEAPADEGRAPKASMGQSHVPFVRMEGGEDGFVGLGAIRGKRDADHDSVRQGVFVYGLIGLHSARITTRVMLDHRLKKSRQNPSLRVGNPTALGEPFAPGRGRSD